MPSAPRLSLLVLAVLAALVAGCGSPAPSSPPPTGSGEPTTTAAPGGSSPPGSTAVPGETPPPSPSPTPVPTPTPLPTPTMAVAPLTGRLVLEAQAKRHPIAVMIDDHWAARPQSGLSQASVVWQAPAEGGIPRYMAIFAEGDPKAVGPVRSARYYFIGWAAEWKAAYVHAGGSPQAMATLAAKGRGQLVYNADEFRWGGGRYLWRIKQRFAPHNVYSDGKHLRALAKRLGATAPPGEPVWLFAPDAPLETRPVGGRIDVTYPHNAIRYRYDRTTNTYLRFTYGKKDTDAAYKRQIAPSNVIVMVVRFGPLNDGSRKGRLEARFIGSGTAWISTNGKTIKGTWKKKSMTGPTRFYDRDGRQVTLTIGQTYIQVVPPGTPVKFVAGKPAPAPSPSPSPSPIPSPAP